MKKMVLITAIWCPSCIIMRPRYQEFKKSIGIDEFVEFDFDDDENQIKEFTIGKTLPVCILYEGEKEVKRIIGEKSVKELNKIKDELKYE